jgi:RNA polymerase sigma factor (sigma-70 family)
MDTFAKLFIETQAALRKYVRRLVRSDTAAEEIVQESFFRTFQRGSDAHTPRAFLFTVARNLAFSFRTQGRATQSNELGDSAPLEVVSTCDGPETALLSAERSQLLEQAVARLPPRCRAVFILRAFHGLSHKEIAQKLGLSPKTVENHLARAVRDTHEYIIRRYR